MGVYGFRVEGHREPRRAKPMDLAAVQGLGVGGSTNFREFRGIGSKPRCLVQGPSQNLQHLRQLQGFGRTAPALGIHRNRPVINVRTHAARH